MILYDIKDEHVLLRDTSQSKLSILVGMDSFSYVILHPERGLHWFRAIQTIENNADTLQKLEYALRGEATLQRPFSEVRIGFTLPLFTAIPDRLFHRGEERSYLEHVGNINEDDLALVDDLMPIKAHQIYKVPEMLVHVLQQIFPGHTHRHWSTLFINHFGNQLFSGSGHHLYLYINRQTLHVLHFREGQLAFQNAFPFHSSKDCLYYTMLIFDQNGISPEDTPVHLCGQLIPDSEVYRLLGKFLPRLQPLPVPGNIRVAEHLNKYPLYFYVDHALNLIGG